MVCVHGVEAVELLEPAHHLDVADAPGVLEGPSRADRHPVGVALQSWPRRRPALDEVHDDRRVHGPFHRGAAGFALTLAVVPVPEREERTFDVDPQIDGGPGANLGRVHVAAKSLRHERGAHLARWRRDPDRAQHRLNGQVDRQVRETSVEGHGVARTIQVVDPRGVRKRIVQHRGHARRSESPKERNRRRYSPVARRRQVDDVDDQCVARLRALDVEGTGLRVDVTQIDLDARQVIDRLQREVEGILGPQLEDGARCDPSHGCHPAEGVGVLGGLGAELQDLDHSGTLAPRAPGRIRLDQSRSRRQSAPRSATDVRPRSCIIVVISWERRSPTRWTPASPPAMRP